MARTKYYNPETGEWKYADKAMGGSGVPIDPTLTQSGAAADAKAVGDKFAELEQMISGKGDELIGTLPQTIPGTGYYLLADTDATVTTDPGDGESLVNVIAGLKSTNAKVTYADGVMALVENTGGWTPVADLTPYIKVGTVFTAMFASIVTATGTGFRIYTGTDLGGTKIADLSFNGSNAIWWSTLETTGAGVTKGTFSWDGTGDALTLFAGGSAGQSIELAIYEGTITDESEPVVTLSLTAGEKKVMDSYVGQTFFSESAVKLYKTVAATGGDDTDSTPDVAVTLPLAGKNVLFIGDSLTFGNMGTDPDTGGQLYPEKNYPQYFSERTGCTVHNKGVSGANGVSYRDNVYPTIDFSVDYAAAIIMLGTNLGLADVYGEAYSQIIENLARDTGGRTQIFLVTPPYNNYSSAVFGYAKNSNAVVKQKGETYCLPVIDAYYESGVNQFNGELCRPVDDLHFNDEGYRRLGYFIANQVLTHGWW